MAGRLRGDFIVLAIAAAVFLACIASPPALMDDMDSAQAQIARNMLDFGDWVTPHLDGIKYLEKAPLKYWLIALSFKIFGEHDWAARLPVALAAVLACWVAYCTGGWAFSPRAGVSAGVILATCAGMFLFTRAQIPDVMLTAPDAPADVFIGDADFRERWRTADRDYICVEQPQVKRLRRWAAPAMLYALVASGGKFVFSNRPVA